MHLLQKHTIDIQCSSLSLGKEVQNMVSDVLEKDFYPKLELILDRYSIENYEWEIEKLSVDLPEISPKNWKKEFVDQALYQIEEYLKDHFPVLGLNIAGEKSENSGWEPQGKYAETLFFEYLKTGMIRENSYSENIEEIVEAVEISKEFIEKMIGLFFDNRNTIIRYYFNTKDSFKQRISTEVSKYSITESLIIFLSSQLKCSSVEELESWIENSELFSEIPEKKCFPSNEPKIGIPGSHEKSDKSNLVENEEEEHTDRQHKKPLNKELKKDQSKNRNSDKQKSTANVDKEDQAVVRDALINKESGTGKLVLPSSGIYIDNAGLVILHPFLPNLFQKLNLYKDEVWKNKQSQHKAILLTQYLVTGQEIFFENELVLNKLMCGFPIESVINTKQKISRKEKETCKDLLIAVINHWNVLKGTSAEALRETFLQRAGKLSVSETRSSELWVEEKGLDILLESLPWGTGMIRTPWMEEFLMVYWNS